MKNTIKVLEEMKATNLIKDYAIGGGIAALYYVEPILTYDLDIFVIISGKKKEKSLIELTPIYDYLKSKGYAWKGEHIMIEGVPVQFIPADKLEEEAIKAAKETIYQEVRTKVLTPEYLITILLRAGRRKDFDKILKLMEQTKVDKQKLKIILKKYHLFEKFEHLDYSL